MSRRPRSPCVPARRARLLVAAALSGCGCAGARPPAPRLRTAARPAVTAPRAPAEPPWTLVAPRGLPLPVRDVGALSGGEAVLLAGDGIFVWDGRGAPRPACASPGPAPRMVQAEGDRFVALGGDEAAPVAWASEDRGGSCARVELPPLFVRDAAHGDLGLGQDGATAHAWSTAGGIARSDDGGRTWRRIADLRGVVRVARGPGDTVLAAARIEGLAADGAARVRLHRLASPGADRWQDLGVERRAPVAFRALSDGRVAVADALGTLALDGEGRPRAGRVEPAYRADAPDLLAPAGGERFVGRTGRLLTVVTPDGARAFAALPGLRPIVCFDAADDGAVWASDARSVWRGTVGATLDEVTDRPLGSGEPVALAARGDVLAVAADDGALARSDDGGARWTRSALPPGLGRPQALSLDPRGYLLALGFGGLAVSEGEGYALTDLPACAGAPPGNAVVATIGDRWVVADGDVYTSDDEGAHWVARFGPHAREGRATGRVLAAALGGGATGFVLDEEHVLWRTDDAAATFHRVGPAATVPTGVAARGVRTPALAWDGGRRVVVAARGVLSVSDDGGASFETAPAPVVPRFVALAPAGTPGGVVAGTLATPGLPLGAPSPCPGGGSSAGAVLVMVRRGDGWSLAPDACAHRGEVWAVDGARLYLLDRLGTLWRGDLGALARAP